MPTVNIFYKDLGQQKDVGRQLMSNSLKDDLKKFIAQELTCNDIKLKPEEVSIRLVNVSGEGMIGDVEIEITAHSFKDRVERQDQICLNIAKYLQKKDALFGEVRVWLILAELGHSWESAQFGKGG
ncbi:MAG: hypothetical protein WC788_00370 [Candidatus Paceibacterota bacterium]|jgi:hypothetical protein